MRTPDSAPPRIRPGDVWWVNDEEIHLPQKPGQVRQLHGTRLVLVVSAQQDCDDPKVWSVLAVPLSSRTDLQRRNDVWLARGEGGLKSNSLAQATNLGPIAKAAFVERAGELPVSRFQQVQVAIRLALGMKPR